MKTIFKTTSLSIVLFTLLSVTAFAFSDTSGHPYADSFEYLSDQGIIQGYDDGTARPDSKVNRAEFLKIVMQAANIPSGDQGNFSDIKDSDWFAPYVYSAASAGIVDGYPDGTFKPGQNVNFVEASKIINNSFNWQMDDWDQIQYYWFSPYVLNLSRAHFIPASINSFDQEITRGEIAEMISRALQGDMESEFHTYGDIVKAQQQKEFEQNPEKFAKSLVEKYNVKLPASQNASWLADDFENQLEALSKYSALYADQYQFQIPCASEYRGVLYFTVPPQQFFVIKEFDKNTLQAVPATPYENEQCSIVFKDDNWVYVYNPQNSGFFEIALGVSDPDTFQAVDGLEGIYRDSENSYIVRKGDLQVINEDQFTVDDLEGLSLSDTSSIVSAIENTHSCYGDFKCLGTRAFPSTFKFYQDSQGQTFFFDGEDFQLTEIDGSTLVSLIPDNVRSSITKSVNIIKDKDNLYRFTPNKFQKILKLDPDNTTYVSISDDQILVADDDYLRVDTEDDYYEINRKNLHEIEKTVLNNSSIREVLYQSDRNSVYRTYTLNQFMPNGLSSNAIPTKLDQMDPETFDYEYFEYGPNQSYFIYGESDNDFWFYNTNDEEEQFVSSIDPETFSIISDFDLLDNSDVITPNGYITYEGDSLCPMLLGVPNIVPSFEWLPGGTCRATVLYQDELNSTFVGLVAKDKNAVYLYTNKDLELIKLPQLDPASVNMVSTMNTLMFTDVNGIWEYDRATKSVVEL